MSSEKHPYIRPFTQILRNRLSSTRGPQLIQVILGPRQVGKTTGVETVLREFLEGYYATADESLATSTSWLEAQWQSAREKHPKNPLLVIDEIQKIDSWSSVIKALWDREKLEKRPFRLVLLGSSSLGLSQGLDESLAGRFEIIPVRHWSYAENATAFQYSLDEHLLFGGYPIASEMKGDYRRWQSYLKNSIIESVIGKDILRHAIVKKPALFRQTFEILGSYPAQEISYNKLLGQIQETGNVDLVKYYLNLFSQAFLIRGLEKYSGSEIQKKRSSPKILPLAPSLYTYRLGPGDLGDPELKGRIFESAVGAELAALPGDLYYWRQGDLEVDFIYQDGKTVFAIEVKSGRRKRTGGLEAFRKKFPKARAAFITAQNFLNFSADPETWLNNL